MIQGKVHDVRFHRYDGPRSGRLAALWSMTRWSALRALGARRGWKAKIIPIALTLAAFFPALVVLGLRALFPSSINDNLAAVLPYSDYAGIVGLVILVFAIVVTPELLCPDRRDGTLALYFATAISRTDYVAGKVFAALLPLMLVTVLPPAILYSGNVLFATFESTRAAYAAVLADQGAAGAAAVRERGEYCREQGIEDGHDGLCQR